mgnify:CR=1 FL=1
MSTLVFRLSSCHHLKCSGKLINIIYFHFLRFFFCNIGEWELHGLTTYHQYNFVCCISISAWLCGGFFIILPIRGTGVYAHYTAINIYLLIFNAVLYNNAVCVLHITFPESIRSRIHVHTSPDDKTLNRYCNMNTCMYFNKQPQRRAKMQWKKFTKIYQKYANYWSVWILCNRKKLVVLRLLHVCDGPLVYSNLNTKFQHY